MQINISSRVFIVGCPRSGTTLLQSLLAAHPNINTFPESHFFALAIPRSLCRRILGLPSSNLKQFFDYFLKNANLMDMQKYIPTGLSNIRLVNWIRAFIYILDESSLREQKKIWIEKTPRHLHYIHVIREFVPNVKFIHILRNGLDTVPSLYRVTNHYPEFWGGKRSLDWCLERWRKDIQLSLTQFGKRDHFLIRYENLVSYTMEVLKEICVFLNVEYTKSMIEKHSCVAEKIILPHQHWINEAKESIRNNANMKRNWDLFNQSEKNMVEEFLKPVQNILEETLPLWKA